MIMTSTTIATCTTSVLISWTLHHHQGAVHLWPINEGHPNSHGVCHCSQLQSHYCVNASKPQKKQPHIQATHSLGVQMVNHLSILLTHLLCHIKKTYFVTNERVNKIRHHYVCGRLHEHALKIECCPGTMHPVLSSRPTKSSNKCQIRTKTKKNR